MLFLLLTGAGIFYLLQHVIYKKYWKTGLDIAVDFESHSAYEGDTSYLREEITNDKRLPLPALEVNLAMDRSLLFSGEAKENANVTDQSYRRDIFLYLHGRRSSESFLSYVKKEVIMRLQTPM